MCWCAVKKLLTHSLRLCAWFANILNILCRLSTLLRHTAHARASTCYIRQREILDFIKLSLWQTPDLIPLLFFTCFRPHWRGWGSLQCLTGQAPAYLTDDCQLTSDVSTRRLRSTDTATCVVRRSNNGFGDRCFAAAGPRLWNTLWPSPSTAVRQSRTV